MENPESYLYYTCQKDSKIVLRLIIYYKLNDFWNVSETNKNTSYSLKNYG